MPLPLPPKALEGNLRYAIFFGILPFTFILLMNHNYSVAWRWCWGWSVLSCSILGVTYAFNRPEWVCGKTRSGSVSVVLTLINLPWLLLTWSMAVLLAVASREPAVNPVAGTNISIARYPLWGVNLSNFSHIVDLTAEFPRFYRFTGHYECLPNLDGVALAQWHSTTSLDKDDRILIHCAQGHGRSATFAAVLLTKMGIFTTPQQAYQAIIQSRPAAKLSRAQHLQLAAFE